MGTKRCLDCGELGMWARDGRCTRCRRQVTRLREMNPQRRAHKAELYNAAFRRARAQWAEVLTVTVVDCPRCHLPIEGAWDLGHQPDGGLRPEHPHCNRSAK